jgi:heptaprenylglyceryl phosphate synthase
MALPESERYESQGLFDNKVVIDEQEALRREAVESNEIVSIVKTIEHAGPIMVIDPEKALDDLNNTLERVKIASENGMKVMEIGGSTDANNGAETVIPAIRDVVDKAGGDTLLISFPGTSSQVIKGVDATFSLFLPQLDSVYRKKPQVVQHLNKEYLEIINRSRQLDVPVIPVTYVLFNGGEKTSVEKVTGIDAIRVQDGIGVNEVMNTLDPWLQPNDLVMLEMGSGPDTSVNLGPVAREVYERTLVRPIVTGGISSPQLMGEVTKHIHSPVVFGSVAERTPPHLFEDLYKSFRDTHPSCKER